MSRRGERCGGGSARSSLGGAAARRHLVRVRVRVRVRVIIRGMGRGRVRVRVSGRLLGGTGALDASDSEGLVRAEDLR